VKYKRTFYVIDVTGDRETLEVEPGRRVCQTDTWGCRSQPWEQNAEYLEKRWGPLIRSAHQWLWVVRQDWIKANKRVQTEYPLRFRYGIAPSALVNTSLPDVYQLDKKLGKTRTRKLVSLVEQGFLMGDENTRVSSMSAADYFEYCRIAYLAVRPKKSIDQSLSGREMYERYADGRHEGLLDIDPDSEQEFADWIDGTHPKRSQGGHPWEIERGGNTTHISLSVSRPSFFIKESFKVELCGASIWRMVETMRMFLAIQAAGRPIAIADPEGVRKRLLGQDNIGIVPAYDSLHRANQRFQSEQDVYDVMYYDDLGRYKRRITPFITWEPLPVLKLRSI